MRTMPRSKLRPTLEEVKALLAQDRDFLGSIVEAVLQELLERRRLRRCAPRRVSGRRRAWGIAAATTAARW
jgi:hypothetical protein